MVRSGWTPLEAALQTSVGDPPASPWAGGCKGLWPLISAHDCLFLCPFSLVYPKLFSHCSEQDMWQFLGDPRTSCLLNTPRADELYGGPVCGNQFVERGEQCDCGTLEVGTLSESPGVTVGSRDMRPVIQIWKILCKPLLWTLCFARLLFLMFLMLLLKNHLQRRFVNLDVSSSLHIAGCDFSRTVPREDGHRPPAYPPKRWSKEGDIMAVVPSRAMLSFSSSLAAHHCISTGRFETKSQALSLG